MGVNIIEAAGAVLIGALFYGLASSKVIKNSGTLEASQPVELEKSETPITSILKSATQKVSPSSSTSTLPVSAESGSGDDPASMYAASGTEQTGDERQLKSVTGLATSLLPNDATRLDDDDFVSISPDLHMKNVNFLTGWQLGRDTAGADKRNMSLDLRSELPNPRFLTPENNMFNNTSIGFFEKRAFEVAEFTVENAMDKKP